MFSSFKQIDPYEYATSPFKIISKEWMLIAAGKTDHYNMMTASWGGFGFLWNKPIAIIFVRPQRYTFEFIENNHDFTLNFFDTEYRYLLNLVGTRSGKDMNKMDIEGLTPGSTEDGGSLFFQEAHTMFECRKIYFNDIDPNNFLDNNIKRIYPDKDYHRMYFGEIKNILKRV